jgi:hypothetical protein
VALSETWNGTAWTEGNNINTARKSQGCTGDATSGLIFAGAPVPKLQTESYDGSSWTEEGDLSAAHDLQMAGTGTVTAALACGGHPGGLTTVEEWTKAVAAVTMTSS